MRGALGRLLRRPGPGEVTAGRAGFHVGHRVRFQHPTRPVIVEGTLRAARESQLSVAWQDLDVELDDGRRVVYAVGLRTLVAVDSGQ